ncbi:MAG: hypothetical protein ACHP9V_07325, partial [Terriglobales bacterium]
YEQLSYHKILPLVCNLSMKISPHRAILAKCVLESFERVMPNFTLAAETLPSEASEATTPVR